VKVTNLKAHLALLFVNVLYGASHVLAKGVMPEYLSPTVFILFRVLGATLLFWLILVFTKIEKINRKDFPLLIACGLFGVAVNQLFFFHGLNLSSSVNSGIIMAMNPIMVVILSFFILKERITVLRSTGIALGFIGTILLTFKGATSKGDSSLGDLFLVINALSYAIYLVIAKPLMQKYKPLTVITWVFTFGLAFVLLFPPTIPELIKTDFSTFTSSVIFKIGYVVVGVTFLTYLLTMYGLKYLSPTVSSSYIYTQPVIVMLFAFLFATLNWSDDYTGTITAQKILYMLLIFAGVYMASLKRKTN
jgi:drug/metabolite transporter (DMT)-like permease